LRGKIMARYENGNYGRSENFGESRRRRTFYRKKEGAFEGGGTKVDYKDARTLQRFTSERGKVMPRRISSVPAVKQRALAAAIKRARFLALLPYVAE
jgi:small subunit ribosomal protein S18